MKTIIKEIDVRIFVIINRNKRIGHGFETHYVRYGTNKPKKISADKWFKLYDQKNTIILQPLYEK